MKQPIEGQCYEVYHPQWYEYPFYLAIRAINRDDRVYEAEILRNCPMVIKVFASGVILLDIGVLFSYLLRLFAVI